MHKDAWSKIWETADVEIRGDVEAQQGVRFCNFHIMQSYSGKDDTITIACKGISAEVYNGGYFWDAEVLAFPLFLFLNPDTAKSILKFRYNTLDKARERAKQFRYRGSVYPWVTVNGTEDCNQWAYAEGEIHNNGCIPWAIYRYVDVTGDIDYLADYGAEVLIEEARFWSDRVNFSEYRKGYVLNCVCGPDEYQVAVSNNYYTNYLARFTLQYAIEAIEIMKGKYVEKWSALSDKLAFNDNEASKWKDIIEKILLPYDAERNIFIQDDEYLSRAEFEPKAIPRDQLPIYKNWPWENTMRFNIIKQPDVLMLFHLLSERFDQETKKSNYDFYESRTIHDSSMSGGIHSIIASDIGNKEDAVKHYLRSARMDLDDYNTNTWEGLHITSFCNTWCSIAYGFGGLRFKDGIVHLSPYVPDGWNGYSFSIKHKNRTIKLKVEKDRVTLYVSQGEEPYLLNIYGKEYKIDGTGPFEVVC